MSDDGRPYELPAAEPDFPGPVLCPRHGCYYYAQDGCPDCQSELDEIDDELHSDPEGDPLDDPDELDWLNPARHPYGPPNQVAPPSCDIVFGYCLVHERPSWMCDEQP